MYSADFDYHRARSLADAQRLLAAHPGAKLLAGGHSLIPLMKLRLTAPEQLVDLARVAELNYIREEGGTLRIGATTTHYQVESSPLVRSKSVPSSRRVRHRRCDTRYEWK